MERFVEDLRGQREYGFQVNGLYGVFAESKGRGFCKGLYSRL